MHMHQVQRAIGGAGQAHGHGQDLLGHGRPIEGHQDRFKHC